MEHARKNMFKDFHQLHTDYKDKLEEFLALNSSDMDQLFQSAVNAPFENKMLATSLDLGIAVLLLVDEKKKYIDRIALSNTELATGTLKVSAKPFHKIRIPYNDPLNYIAQAIKHDKHYLTDDWFYLFTPALSAAEARRNQAGGSIECSLVMPLDTPRGGAMIFSFYQPKELITNDHIEFAKSYAKLVSDKLKNFIN